MNLWDHAKQLADAASETNQQIGSQIDKAVAATKHATEELATTSAQALQQAQQVAKDR